MAPNSAKAGNTMLHAVKSFVVDGWTNVLTGLGSIGADKRMSSTIGYSRMAESDAEQLYAGSDIAAKIVDVEPEDATRQWFTFTSNVEGLSGQVDTALDTLHAAPRLTEAWIWGRLYGGAAILIAVDDSKPLEDPLDMGLVRSIKALTVLTRWELQPDEIDDDLESPRFGEPTFYRFTPQRGGATGDQTKGDRIHHSRLLPFYGARLPFRQRQQNQYWHDSVLNRVQNAIRNYETVNDAVATIMQEFNQGVFKMKGLADMLLAGQDEAVQKRLTTVQLARSICRAVVIDSESEEFTNVGAHVQGIPDMVRTVDKRLVVASKMPHTKILGESPSGLGATGESEQDDWNDHISNQQELILRPKIQRLIEILLSSRKGPTSGKLPDEWHFEFNPLKQTSESQVIANRKAQADIDKIYIENQVVDPAEVRQSRFGSGKFSHDTTIEGDIERPENTEDDGTDEAGNPKTADKPVA